jgi:hypothetical protein
LLLVFAGSRGSRLGEVYMSHDSEPSSIYTPQMSDLFFA